MSIFRHIAIFIPGVCLFLSSSCSSDKRSRQEHREEEQLAVEYGRRQAVRLAVDSLILSPQPRGANPTQPQLDTIAIERTLIDVRVREASLRKRGEDKLADIYINTFLSTLDSVNPSLRAALQQPLPR